MHERKQDHIGSSAGLPHDTARRRYSATTFHHVTTNTAPSNQPNHNTSSLTSLPYYRAESRQITHITPSTSFRIDRHISRDWLENIPFTAFPDPVGSRREKKIMSLAQENGWRLKKEATSTGNRWTEETIATNCKGNDKGGTLAATLECKHETLSLLCSMRRRRVCTGDTREGNISPPPHTHTTWGRDNQCVINDTKKTHASKQTNKKHHKSSKESISGDPAAEPLEEGEGGGSREAAREKLFSPVCLFLVG